MSATTTTGRILGSAIKRREDPRLMTGAGTFVDDMRVPGMVEVALVRSPHAHARIRGIDGAKARNARLVTQPDSKSDGRPSRARPVEPGL